MNFTFKQIKPNVVCKDGFKMSVQASSFHYSSPRCNNGPYSQYEIGFPSEKEELLMPYCEDDTRPTETVYCYVPVDIIKTVIEKHGGEEGNSGWEE